MAIDSEKNTQILLTVSRELLEKIEEYQFKNKIQSRSKAMRELLEKALGK